MRTIDYFPFRPWASVILPLHAASSLYSSVSRPFYPGTVGFQLCPPSENLPSPSWRPSLLDSILSNSPNPPHMAAVLEGIRSSDGRLIRWDPSRATRTLLGRWLLSPLGLWASQTQPALFLLHLDIAVPGVSLNRSNILFRCNFTHQYFSLYIIWN